MHPKKHIFLTGFMGTGKSLVGPRLATRLNLAFLDSDSCLELKFEKSIPQIFARKGGQSFFRKAETEFLRSLLLKNPLVASLGGGMVLAAENREFLRKGIWINLKASPAVILRRIGKKNTRPLLQKKGKQSIRDTLEALLKSRSPFYDLAPFQIETDSLSVEGIVVEIMRILSCYCEE